MPRTRCHSPAWPQKPTQAAIETICIIRGDKTPIELFLRSCAEIGDVRWSSRPLIDSSRSTILDFPGGNLNAGWVNLGLPITLIGADCLRRTRWTYRN
jgi:hypothetical protein